VSAPQTSRTLLVTGGASGIGLATVRRMARTMKVVVADIDGGAAAAVAKTLAAEGAEAIGIEADVRNRASVLAMAEAARRTFGGVDALFNNAGISQSGATADLAEADWDRIIDTHVKGAFLCSQALLPGMIERGGGAIVNMASIYAVTGMVNGGAYAAAKSAILSLTKTLALEFIDRGIRVNAIGPGPIDTPLLHAAVGDDAWDGWKAMRTGQVPMGRLGAADEIAALVEFLLGERASYITGQLLLADGGQVNW
jgi:NAD(P)-dependent dehydrogenase (short-subunit alcohol dehydrogenase family)